MQRCDRAAFERFVGKLLAAANDVCGLRRKLGRSSAAVATSREGHRSPRSDPTVRYPRWGQGRWKQAIAGCRKRKWPRQKGTLSVVVYMPLL
jgi:hypothetical protein